MKQLSWTDAMMLRGESPGSPLQINPVMIYDQSTAPGGRVTFTGILDVIRSRLDRTPAFRRRLVDVPLGLGTPYWVEDEHFDLEYHVRHVALPKPGDWRQLCIQIARLHSRPLDLTRPPWEMTVIEGLDAIPGLPEGAFAVSVKIHHAAVDGMAGAEIISVLHDLEPIAPPDPQHDVDQWDPEPMPSAWNLLGRSGLAALRHPVRAARVLGTQSPHLAPRIVSGAAAGVRGLFVENDDVHPTSIPSTRFNGPTTPHRVCEARFYDFGDVRRIKAAVPGATVNDVVLAHVGGTLRAYLENHEELPDASLLAACPISTRGTGDRSTEGNSLSFMRQAVGTDIADPAERLSAIAAEGHESRGGRAKGAPELLEIAELVPGLLVGIGLRGVTTLLTGRPLFANVTVTNVPGSPRPLYFAGAEAVRLFGNGPLFPGVGLIHLVGTYNGLLSHSFTSCRDLMPDPGFYADCMDRAFADLLGATVG